MSLVPVPIRDLKHVLGTTGCTPAGLGDGSTTQSLMQHVVFTAMTSTDLDDMLLMCPSDGEGHIRVLLPFSSQARKAKSSDRGLYTGELLGFPNCPDQCQALAQMSRFFHKAPLHRQRYINGELKPFEFRYRSRDTGIADDAEDNDAVTPSTFAEMVGREQVRHEPAKKSADESKPKQHHETPTKDTEEGQASRKHAEQKADQFSTELAHDRAKAVPQKQVMSDSEFTELGALGTTALRRVPAETAHRTEQTAGLQKEALGKESGLSSGQVPPAYAAAAAVPAKADPEDDATIQAQVPTQEDVSAKVNGPYRPKRLTPLWVSDRKNGGAPRHSASLSNYLKSARARSRPSGNQPTRCDDGTDCDDDLFD